MSKKILKGPMGLFGKKKKKAETADSGAGPSPIISALSPEETRKRKLLRNKAPVGLGTSILGSGAATSGTLGG